jgi:alpha-1,6-mannosyltransferase
VTDARVERHSRFVLLAIAAAAVVAVAVPPRNSHDLWSYVMYGRTLAVHHVSPYAHPPSDFRGDPFFTRVAHGWQHTKSVYGPLFTGGSALLTKVAGDSALRARLMFQGLAALSVGGALALVWLETRSARALVFVGLNPAIVTTVVNGGHNDAIVGLTVLAGALLAARHRYAGAGLVLALGLLVKASAGLGLLGIAAWTLTRDRRGASRLLAVAAAAGLVAYLPAGFVAARDATHAGNGNTHASFWDPITTVTHVSVSIVLVLVLVLAAVAAYLRRQRSQPSAPALASTAAYLMAGAYVLPWYSAWALPTAALERRSRLAWLVAVQSVFLTAVYEFELPAHPLLKGVLAGVRTTFVQIGAWVLLAAFLVILFGSRGREPARES